MKLLANISMLFTEFPLMERIEAAKSAGFDGVEIQFPDAAAIRSLSTASVSCKMPVALINVPRGPGDSVGLAALPEQEEAYRAAVATCAEHAAALGVRKINVLAGRPPAEAQRSECLATLKRNLVYTADVMSATGISVMVEAVNRQDVPGFFISGVDEALALLDDIDHPNLALQFDFYHMALTEPDLVTAILRAGPKIGHVQFADTPGRNEPGTGATDFAAAFAALAQTGYNGDVSAEYNPVAGTVQGLSWMADFKRMMA